MDLKKLKIQSKQLSPMVNVGKNGLTEAVSAQILTVLKKKKLIKIKFLKSYIAEQKDNGVTVKQIGLKMASEMRSTLIDAVGFVIVLARNR